MEHYRGDFRNKAMYTPLATSALTLLASFHGHRDFNPKAHWARDTIYALAGLTGLIGTAFHLYNVGKRPGGFCWQNVFYGAPLGAPAAMSLAGMTEFLAERVRDNPPGAAPDVLGMPAGRVVAALTGGGLVGTAMEAGLLHFRGAFHNPAMLLPVTAPPAAAVMLGAAAIGENQPPRRLTRWWLRVTALLGVAGVGFHAIGVARNMGGWRNWTQNLQDGPPLAGSAVLHWTRARGPRGAQPSRGQSRWTEKVTSGRYPGYDAMSKRDGPSWNDKTREVIDAQAQRPESPELLFGRGMAGARRRFATASCLSPKGVVPRRLRLMSIGLMSQGKTKGYRFAGHAAAGRSVEARSCGTGRGRRNANMAVSSRC